MPAQGITDVLGDKLSSPVTTLNTSASTSAEMRDEECPILSAQVESSQLKGLFELGSNGVTTFAYVRQGKGNRLAGIDYEHAVGFCVTVPDAGLYALKANVHAQGASNDSMYVQVNSSPQRGYIWNASHGGGFVDDYVSDAGDDQRIQLALDSGVHQVEFFLREDDTRISGIELEPRLSAASSDASATTQLRYPIAANSIYGHVHTDIGDPWQPRNVDPQIADITIELNSAGPRQYDVSRSVRTDSAGNFYFENLPASSYQVNIIMPDEHFALGPEKLDVSVVDGAQAVVSFDLMVMDAVILPAEEEAKPLDRDYYIPLFAH